jgi:hypothetical protein
MGPCIAQPTAQLEQEHDTSSTHLAHCYQGEYPVCKYGDENCPATPKVKTQPEQEPVGDDWTPCMKLPVVVYVRKQRLGESHVSTREGITPVKPDDLIMRGVSGEEYPIGRAIFEQTYSLNITPPQRTWVGLTYEEKSEMWEISRAALPRYATYATLIEANLKELNT